MNGVTFEDVLPQMGILGKRVRDVVSGLEGVAASVCFDLYGCVQIAVTPPAKDGKLEVGNWFDYHRLEVLDENRVMPLPSFQQALMPAQQRTEETGPSDKPASNRY
jgi:hypothetical protein